MGLPFTKLISRYIEKSERILNLFKSQLCHNFKIFISIISLKCQISAPYYFYYLNGDSITIVLILNCFMERCFPKQIFEKSVYKLHSLFRGHTLLLTSFYIIISCYLFISLIKSVSNHSNLSKKI